MANRRRPEAIETAMLLVGTVLGGGFVSGKELVKFFGGSGAAFVWCSVLTGILYALIVLLVMGAASHRQVYDLHRLSECAFGPFRKVFDAFLFFCYFIIMSAMLAATEKMFGGWFPTVATLFGCGVLISTGIDGLKRVNSFLVPIIIIFLLFISFSTMRSPETTGPMWELAPRPAVISLGFTVLYVCMNMLTTCGVLAESSRGLNKRQIVLCAVLFGIIMTLLVYCVGRAVLSAGGRITESDLPILLLSARYGSWFGILFRIVLFFGIFTTLLSSAYPASKYLTRKPEWLFRAGLLGGAYLFSRLGFSAIVESVYPLMGILGVICFLSFAISTLPAERRIRFRKNVFSR